MTDSVAPTGLAAPRPTIAGLPQSTWAMLALVAAIAGAAWWQFGRPSVSITRVHAANNVVVGDGTPQPIKLSFTSRNADVQSLEVRLVNGPDNWPKTTQSLPVVQPGNGSEIDAGAITAQVATPTRVTYAYALLSHNGTRSEPFEQSFDVLPPVVITSAKFTSAPRLQQPTAVLLNYRRGGADIVEVRRRVLDSSLPWAQADMSMPVSLNQASGTFEVPIEAPTQPMRSTLEFQMVDAAGVTSAPVRLTMNVAVQPITSGPATVLSVQLVSGSGEPSGLGAIAGGAAGAALGNRIGAGSGRTAATVLAAIGGAVAGNMVEQRVRGPSVWETVVRFDDGNTRRIRHTDPPRWAAGQRVVVSGGAISG